MADDLALTLFMFVICMAGSNWMAYRRGQNEGVELAYDILSKTGKVGKDGWLYTRLHKVRDDGDD